jgi:hypothetical protein
MAQETGDGTDLGEEGVTEIAGTIDVVQAQPEPLTPDQQRKAYEPLARAAFARTAADIQRNLQTLREVGRLPLTERAHAFRYLNGRLRFLLQKLYEQSKPGMHGKPGCLVISSDPFHALSQRAEQVAGPLLRDISAEIAGASMHTISMGHSSMGTIPGSQAFALRALNQLDTETGRSRKSLIDPAHPEVELASMVDLSKIEAAVQAHEASMNMIAKLAIPS